MKPLYRLALSSLAVAPLVACGADEASHAAPPPPTVEYVLPIQREIVDWDEFTGRLEAVESVDVRARVSGYLESIHFEDGQVVEQGDLLFVIDPRPFQAELDMRVAEMEQLRVARDLAATHVERGRKLLESRAIAAEDVDVRVRSLVRGSMSEAQRDHLAARLRSSWPEPGAPRALRTMVGLVALGELIERPFDPSDEAWRDSAHRALLAHRIEGHGAFADHAGQFGDGAPGRKMERPLLEPTHAAVRLMRHFDVPDGIDPVAAVRYLERMATPSLVEATAPRAWGLLTVQDYRYHGAVALAELRELLGDSEANVELERLDRARALVVTRILLATLALVALCLFATLRARPGPSRAAVPG